MTKMYDLMKHNVLYSIIVLNLIHISSYKDGKIVPKVIYKSNSKHFLNAIKFSDYVLLQT
jgi:hypothetical protein